MQNVTKVKSKEKDWVCSYCADHSLDNSAQVIWQVERPTNCHTCGRIEQLSDHKNLFRRPYTVGRAYKMLEKYGQHQLSRDYLRTPISLHLNPVDYAKERMGSSSYASEIAQHVVFLYEYQMSEQGFCLSKQAWRKLRLYAKRSDF